jgi:hypothetical protein
MYSETVNTCTNKERVDVVCEIRYGLHQLACCIVTVTAVKMHMAASTSYTQVLKYRMADTVVSECV